MKKIDNKNNEIINILKCNEEIINILSSGVIRLHLKNKQKFNNFITNSKNNIANNNDDCNSICNNNTNNATNDNIKILF